MECVSGGVPLGASQGSASGRFCFHEDRVAGADGVASVDPVVRLRRRGLLRLGVVEPRKPAPFAPLPASVRPSSIRPQIAIRPSTPVPEQNAGKNWPVKAGPVPYVFRIPPPVRSWHIRGNADPVEPAGRALILQREIDLGELKYEGQTADRISVKPETLDADAIDLSTQRLREIWRKAPGDLKLIATVIPMILLLALNAAGPRLYSTPVAVKASSGPAIDGLLSRQWHAFKSSVAQRAGFQFADDFHSGLDNWTVRHGAGAAWGYDNTGFVKPGGLALFRPTLQVADCDIDFAARIEQRALGFVFRAKDMSNYQAVRLVLTRPEPLPEVRLVRYAVVKGREGPKVDKPVPYITNADMFFNVHLSVRGSDFTLMVQGKVADFWTDDRTTTGGVGFFCARGESARVRRVEVSHQNDTLGRLCAYIASEKSD